MGNRRFGDGVKMLKAFCKYHAVYSTGHFNIQSNKELVVSHMETKFREVV